MQVGGALRLLFVEDLEQPANTLLADPSHTEQPLPQGTGLHRSGRHVGVCVCVEGHAVHRETPEHAFYANVLRPRRVAGDQPVTR